MSDNARLSVTVTAACAAAWYGAAERLGLPVSRVVRAVVEAETPEDAIDLYIARQAERAGR
jgi:hypothetical protein